MICNGFFSALIPEAYGLLGGFAAGFALLPRAIQVTHSTSELVYVAEIHRIEGNLIMQHEAQSVPAAWNCFELAIEISREQCAKSLELRATTSLARLLASQDNRDEARARLTEVYNWFTEGFDTADLKEAKVLLDDLNHPKIIN